MKERLTGLPLPLAAALVAAGAAAAQDPVRARVDALLTTLESADAAGTMAALGELERLSTPASAPLVRWYLELLARGERGRFAIQKMDPLQLVRGVLLHMGPGALPAVEPLLDAVRAREPKTYAPALAMLAEIGPYQPAFRDRLRALEPPSADVTDEEAWVGFEWQRLQRRREIDPTLGTAALLALLESDDRFVLEFAAELLARRGGDAAPAVPALLRLLGTDFGPFVWHGATLHRVHEPAHLAAIEALVAIAPDDPRIVPALVRRLRPPFRLADRRDAAQRIARLGPKAADAVPALIRMRNSWDDDRLMQEVVEALGAIGAAARDALPVLEEIAALAEWDEELQQAARAAIAKVRG